MGSFRGRAAAAALLTLALAACNAAGEPSSPPADAAKGGGRAGGGRGRGEGAPVPVVTAHVETKSVPVTVPAVGTVEALTTVQVRAQVTGQLGTVHFAEGQEVRKGQPLFSLDSRPFEVALQQAEAVLARDTATAENAKAQQARTTDLFKRGLISREQFDTQNASVAALQGTLAADQAAVENAKLNLQYTRILAPINGRTGALGVHGGDLVRANDTSPMVVINQLAPIYVTFSVPGRFLTDIRRYQAGKPLVVRATARAGTAPGAVATAPPPPGTPGNAEAPTSPADATEVGAVTFIDNTVDATTGTIKLKGTFPNTDHGLWPGLFVQVSLELTTNAGALVVPAAAVQASQSGQFIYVVKADRTVEIRPVTVQRQQGEEMIIAQGVNAGEEIVTDGHLRLTPGARVTTGGNRGEGAGAGAGGGAGGGRGGEGAGGGRRGDGRGARGDSSQKSGASL